MYQFSILPGCHQSDDAARRTLGQIPIPHEHMNAPPFAGLIESHHVALHGFPRKTQSKGLGAEISDARFPCRGLEHLRHSGWDVLTDPFYGAKRSGQICPGARQFFPA